MAFRTYNVSVGSSAVALLGDDDQADRRSAVIFNNGTATIYVGPTSGVTVAAGSNLGGLPIIAGGSLTLDHEKHDRLYAIAASGSHDVRVMTEEG